MSDASHSLQTSTAQTQSPRLFSLSTQAEKLFLPATYVGRHFLSVNHHQQPLCLMPELLSDQTRASTSLKRRSSTLTLSITLVPPTTSFLNCTDIRHLSHYLLDAEHIASPALLHEITSGILLYLLVRRPYFSKSFQLFVHFSCITTSAKLLLLYAHLR